MCYAQYTRIKTQVARFYQRTDAAAQALTQLSTAESEEIQRIAASQIRLLDGYYNAALAQAKTSFRWASIIAVIGTFFFLGAVASLFTAEAKDLAVLSVIGGIVVEVVSGINFFLR